MNQAAIERRDDLPDNAFKENTQYDCVLWRDWQDMEDEGHEHEDVNRVDVDGSMRPESFSHSEGVCSL